MTKINSAIAFAVLIMLSVGGASHAQSTTIQPFGSGSIINTPGQRPVVCTPFGSGVICN